MRIFLGALNREVVNAGIASPRMPSRANSVPNHVIGFIILIPKSAYPWGNHATESSVHRPCFESRPQELITWSARESHLNRNFNPFVSTDAGKR